MTTTPPLFAMEAGAITTDDYYTPPWIFETMGLTFDLDVCAPAGGVPWIPAARHFSLADDGLSQPWEGRVWMNPPFSSANNWVLRFLEHRDGVALTVGSKSRWFHRLWQEADGVVSLPSDLKFVREEQPGGIFMPTYLWAFGPASVEAISRVGRTR